MKCSDELEAPVMVLRGRNCVLVSGSGIIQHSEAGLAIVMSSPNQHLGDYLNCFSIIQKN